MRSAQPNKTMIRTRQQFFRLAKSDFAVAKQRQTHAGVKRKQRAKREHVFWIANYFISKCPG